LAITKAWGESMHRTAIKQANPAGALTVPGTSGTVVGANNSWHLLHRGYLALMGTQFFGTLNDNLFKVTVSLLAVGAVAEQQAGSGPLSLATLMVIVPYLLFSGYAGYLADCRQKRTTIIVLKFAELVLTILIMLAFALDSLILMMLLLFLMATQSTFFMPLKYGILPELVGRRALARANGTLELGRYIAIIIGTAVGGLLLSLGQETRLPLAMALVSVAGLGIVASLFIPAVRVDVRCTKPTLNPWAELRTGLQRLYAMPDLATAVIGLACFEFTAVLVLLDVLLIGKEVMDLSHAGVGGLGAMTGLGTGAGCVVAGWLCGDRLRPVIVLPAALSIAVLLVLLTATPQSYPIVGGGLFFGGLFGGIVFVPLNAMLQDRAPDHERGLILATSNWLSMAGVLAAAIVLWVLHDLAAISPVRILGIAALPMALFAALAFAAQPAFRLGAGRHQLVEPSPCGLPANTAKPGAREM
jgi:acyl-[acyl-carrier-protein]-phospholipid O-acyltransferase/long-chain-fatty-acid--[acyl-carrier-protein] ligase